MKAHAAHLNNLAELRTYIHHQLCEHEHLEPNIFPMTEHILVRGGKPCGMLFSLYGPRSVRLTAIWEADGNRVLFYGATGERFGQSELVQTPQLATALA